MGGALERVTVKQAAHELGMDITSVQHMMRQERLPIGIAMKKEGKIKWHYYIFRNMLDDFKSGRNSQGDKDETSNPIL